jgi:hypothetical protein
MTHKTAAKFASLNFRVLRVRLCAHAGACEGRFSIVCKYENHKIIACFPSSLFFVIIKRDFITDYLNVPAFTAGPGKDFPRGDGP